MWILGDHRLICGDALSPGAYTTLMVGKTRTLAIHRFALQRADRWLRERERQALAARVRHGAEDLADASEIARTARDIR